MSLSTARTINFKPKEIAGALQVGGISRWPAEFHDVLLLVQTAVLRAKEPHARATQFRKLIELVRLTKDSDLPALLHLLFAPFHSSSVGKDFLENHQNQEWCYSLVGAFNTFWATIATRPEHTRVATIVHFCDNLLKGWREDLMECARSVLETEGFASAALSCEETALNRFRESIGFIQVDGAKSTYFCMGLTLSKEEDASIYRGFDFDPQHRGLIAIKKIVGAKETISNWRSAITRLDNLTRVPNFAHVDIIEVIVGAKLDSITIVMGHCKDLDLETFIHSRPFVLSEEDKWRMIDSLIHIGYYLAINNIEHRHLLPYKLLVTDKGGLKLADFSRGSLLNNADLSYRHRNSLFIAPEVRKNADFTGNSKCDLWSVGALIVFICSGSFTEDQLLAYHQPFPADKICSEADGLVALLLCESVELRLDWFGFFSHPIINRPDLVDAIKIIQTDNSSQVEEADSRRKAKIVRYIKKGNWTEAMKSMSIKQKRKGSNNARARKLLNEERNGSEEGMRLWTVYGRGAQADTDC